jgi:hypothetical protein
LDQEGGARWYFEIVSEFEVLGKHLSGIQGFYTVTFENLEDRLRGDVLGHLIVVMVAHHVGDGVTRQQRSGDDLRKDIQRQLRTRISGVYRGVGRDALLAL